MPIITAHIIEGRTRDQTNAFVREVSRVTVETLSVPEEAVRIILTEVSPDHWGVGPKTMAELRRGD